VWPSSRGRLGEAPPGAAPSVLLLTSFGAAPAVDAGLAPNDPARGLTLVASQAHLPVWRQPPLPA
jgi:hypothetical protein